MADILNEMLNLSRGGYFADCAVVTEDKKSKAKALLRKPGKGAPDRDSDQGRGYRAYLRATASGRDGSYLLDQKGPAAAGAKVAARHMGESVTEAKAIKKAGPGPVAESLIEFAAQHGITLTEYESKQLDQWWKESRPKLIKGSKATRQRRLNGCIKALRSVVRDGGVVGDGQSQDHLNPVPKKERDSEDQPRDGTPGELNTHPRKDAIGESAADTRSDTLTQMESSMSSLTDAIAAFRSLDEANINAPTVDRKTAGVKQYSPKSRWPKQHWDEAGKPPADPESMAAATRSTAGVDKKMGYDADGREGVDVRAEDMDNDELGAFLDEMVNVSEGLEDLAHLIDKYVGVEHLRSRLAESNGDESAYELAMAIGQAKYGETIEHLTRKGMALQNHFGDDDWAGDRAFAEAMLNDTLDRRGKQRHEQNLRAPAVNRKTPDGKAQMSPKSKFSRGYYPGPGVTYNDDSANMPADREAMAAATRSTAGVSGQGYGADGREEVDVRNEDRQPRSRGRGDVNGGSMADIIAGIENQSYPDELLQR